jgi:small-conductance mechanosensitive channel
MEFYGIRLIGFDQQTLRRILLTLAVIGAAALLKAVAVGVVRVLLGRQRNDRVTFWTRQGASLAAFVLILLAVFSIWFDNPARLTTVLGLATAGLAIAAQNVVASFAGYLIIMRGKTFTVGDRIKMGGVQGDVIALGFLQTRILEMGQPPEINEQEAPGMWVRERQFTGRIVTVTNDKIFSEPVYNFTREFPFIWDEITVLLPFDANHDAAEPILIDAAREAAASYTDDARSAIGRVQKRYGTTIENPKPTGYWRFSDKGLELTVRFLLPEHQTREIKDQITRTVMRRFRAANIRMEVTQR